MDATVLLIFGFVYLGMILGRIPFLAVDRAGIALLGIIALIAAGRMTAAQAWQAVDVSTMALLLGLMVVSAQFRLGGFYAHVTRRLGTRPVGPARLLLWLVLVAGGLSALLANDIVCLAMTPVLLEICARRGLNPMPFLLGLACAANVGSAATLIGNPQNMLIGQSLQLSFAGYLWDAAPPAALGLITVWAIVTGLFRHQWYRPHPLPPVTIPPFDRWQTLKGVAVLAGLVAAFLLAPWPREMAALTAAGILLASRRMASRRMLGLVDWQLLVLFAGLFAVNAGLAASGMLQEAFAGLTAWGLRPETPVALFLLSVGLSNIVSNVPATMLLLPAATHPLAGPVLALSSTLAGNLLLVGSIANIIVVDQAQQYGFHISWHDHLRVGVPVTLATLLLAALWLWIRSRAF